MNSSHKSSSRAGRFKKKLVSADELIKEAPYIEAKLAPFLSLNLSQSEFTACYILVYLSQRYPQTWAGSLRGRKILTGPPWHQFPFQFEPNIIDRLGNQSLLEIFANYAFKSCPIAVNRAILEWFNGTYDLEHMFRIPSPVEVLNQQKMGRRCVTTIVDHRISKYILGQRDALSFTMHDLIHADHFYFNNDCYQGQLGVYGLLAQSIDYFDLTHEKFAAEFEYIIADMNAYAIHLLKCLKSAMIHYFSTEYFNGWFSLVEAPEELSLLNMPGYDPVKMDVSILKWLDKFRFKTNSLKQ
jgi:hypothetical protein